MNSVRGVCVCVEYDDILQIVLPRNLRHCSEIFVVTSPRDMRTRKLVEQTPGARLYVTDAFYRRGAFFNKGLALEEAFDVMGRHGWIMIFDADTLLPPQVNWDFLQQGILYSPSRHMLDDPTKYTDVLDWNKLVVKEEVEWAGYCQIFNAHDPAVERRRPWYGVNWYHAGGCDSDFQYMWPWERKKRPPFRVLHLGVDGRNWFGRTSNRLDGDKLPDQESRASLMERIYHDRAFRVGRIE